MVDRRVIVQVVKNGTAGGEDCHICLRSADDDLQRFGGRMRGFGDVCLKRSRTLIPAMVDGTAAKAHRSAAGGQGG